jgi:hypothetical protein
LFHLFCLPESPKIARSPVNHKEDSTVTYIRIQGDKISLGRVEVDFTPEWVPHRGCPNVRPGAGWEMVNNEVRTIAVPRARIQVRGSNKAFEIRDLGRIQRLRKMFGPGRSPR